MDDIQNENNVSEQADKTAPAEAATATVSPSEVDLDVYPLRAPSEDPRWAVWVVWTWVIVAIALALFFIVLIVLGFWYD